MTNPLLVAVADGLARARLHHRALQLPVQGARRPRARSGAGARSAATRAVLEQVRARRCAPRRLVIGGKSMGGRMASHLAAQGVAVDGLLFLGYPLHPAGRPEQLRAAHLAAHPPRRCSSSPARATRSAGSSCCARCSARLPTATLHVVEDGDHSFAVPQAQRAQPGRGGRRDGGGERRVARTVLGASRVEPGDRKPDTGN